MEKEKIIGYKAFNKDAEGLYCQPDDSKFRYKEGEVYKIEGELSLCENGIHFCRELKNVFQFYSLVQWVSVHKVEILGNIIDDEDNIKSCTNKLKILEEVSFEDIIQSFKLNSDGVNRSFGILNSNGVSNSLFLVNKKENYSIFGKEVSEERFEEVRKKLYELLENWRPTFNNLKSLYLKYGSEWKLTPIQAAEEIQKKEAWASMPIEAIKYVMSLEEFDKKMFEEITAIDIDKIKE